MKKTKDRQDDRSWCLLNPVIGCGAVTTAKCHGCGWNRTEELRRRKLPLVKGKDKLWRKVVRKEQT